MNYSAKCASKVGRILASKRGITNPSSPSWIKNTTFEKRWNSSKAPNSSGGRAKASIEGGRVGGWPTIHVIGAVASTSVLAYVIATSQATSKKLKEKDYSNPLKFVEPKYASIKAMETVSSSIRQPIS
jgi:hypothetical protein